VPDGVPERQALYAAEVEDEAEELPHHRDGSHRPLNDGFGRGTSLSPPKKIVALEAQLKRLDARLTRLTAQVKTLRACPGREGPDR
jgi:hypothetical protein